MAGGGLGTALAAWMLEGNATPEQMTKIWALAESDHPHEERFTFLPSGAVDIGGRLALSGTLCTYDPEGKNYTAISIMDCVFSVDPSISPDYPTTSYYCDHGFICARYNKSCCAIRAIDLKADPRPEFKKWLSEVIAPIFYPSPPPASTEDEDQSAARRVPADP